MATGIETVIRYFNEHPGEKDAVARAYFAYHAPHPNTRQGAHMFYGGSREDECSRCGRRRWQVRWDVLPPECAAWRPAPDIEGIIFDEERKYIALLERASHEIPQVIAKRGMSAETLFFLRDTMGYDVDTVSAFADVPQELLSEYHEMMECKSERDSQVGKARAAKYMLEVTHRDQP